MPVEDDADLLGMFDPAEHGVAAIYTPAASVRMRWLGLDFLADSYTTVTRGDPVPVTVMWLRPEDSFGGDTPANLALASRVMVPAVSLPARPLRNDLIEIGALAYRVAEVRQEDDGALFTLQLRRA